MKEEKLSARWARKAACLVASGAMAMTTVVAAPLPQALAAPGDTVSIGSASELASFRDAVNAGNDYEGQTVRLSQDLTLSGSWTPIGTDAHPFRGTFDGGGHSIAGLQVSGTENLGFFGYVGVGGKIENLSITNGDDGGDASTVTATSGTRVVRNVGSVAGYVYGTPGASAIENCSSEAEVTVTSTMKSADAQVGQFTPEGETAEGGTAMLASGATDGGVTIENIGGVVGYSASGISDTSYSGALSATTHEDPNPNAGTYVGATVGGIAGQVGGYSTTEEISSAERALTIAHYPQADGSYAQTASAAATVTGCENSGTMQVVADGNGGLDRFGAAMSAAFMNVGGIVGNSFANVESSTNTCDVVARSSAATGGIVGTLRGSTYTGSSQVLNDAGEQFSYEKTDSGYEYTKTSEGPTLTVSRCTNQAAVTGLAQVGGIMGEGGTHTVVSLCKNVRNGNKDQAVTGTRWNKPMPGGIAGMTHGDVTHCYNRVDVITETGGGYYASGLVGLLGRYTKDGGDAGDSPIPQLDSSYSTGTVQASGAYRQAGICGENNGVIHDCYMLEGSVLNVSAADDSQPYRPMVAENYGTVADSVGTRTGDEMKSKDFCGAVNAATTLSEYRADESFLPDFSDESRALNDGYPVFGFERTAAEDDADRAEKPQLESAGLTAEGTGSATYQADGNPVPQLSLSYQSTKLVQGADYFVIPDASAADANGDCRSISEIGGTDFHAHVVGIGDYRTGDAQTGSAFTAPYQVGKGQFSSCSASVVSKDFDFLAHYPSASEVTITDAAGNVVPSDQYSFQGNSDVASDSWVDYHVTYPSKSYDKKTHVGYEMKFTAGADSNYEGELYGYFRINKAELFRSDKTHFSGFEFNGQTWSWKGSRVVGGKMVGGYLYQTSADGTETQGMKIVYTGEEIRPQALDLQYEDGNGQLRTLEAGKDYRVIYGDPGRDDLISKDFDSNTNVASGTGEVGTRPCATVRYVPGNTHNFANYQNFFFDIVAADVSDSSQVTITANDTLDADSVVVKGYTGATISADNYTVEREEGSDGKITLTVTGKNNLTGTKTLTVGGSDTPDTPDPTPEPTPTPDPEPTPTPDNPDTPSVVTQVVKGGVTYEVSGTASATATKVSASAKTVSIPATVKIGSTSYKVTAVGAKAAKGNKKLGKLTIGANVTSIGKQAFQGCGKLKTVTIKTTKLGAKSIGSAAFSKIAAKAKVKVPKTKVSVYKKYLKKAGLPKKATVKK